MIKSFLSRVFGSENPPPEKRSLLNNSKSSSVVQSLLSEASQAPVSPPPLAGRLRISPPSLSEQPLSQEEFDRADTVAQERLGLSESPSSTNSPYLLEELPADEPSLSSFNNLRVPSQDISALKPVRFSKEEELNFFRSINPFVAKRMKNVIVRLIRLIGDLLAQLRGTTDERFKNQILKLARQDVGMCALLNLGGSDLEKLVETILKESNHHLTQQLETISRQLKKIDSNHPRCAELKQKQKDLQPSLKAIIQLFSKVIDEVANEVSYLNENKTKIHADACKGIRTIGELERLVIQGYACGEINLQKMFQVNVLGPDNEDIKQARSWIIDSLKESSLSMADKVIFLKKYDMLDESNAFEILVGSTFVSFEDDLNGLTKLEQEGIHMSFSLLKASLESATKDIGMREGLDVDICSLAALDPILTHESLARLQKQDPFARHLFQAWALADPEARGLTTSEIGKATMAHLLGNRLREMDDRTLATKHIHTRTNAAVSLAQYMHTSKTDLSSTNRAQLQLFMALCPYGRGEDGKTLLFDALGNTKLFKLFDQGLDLQISQIPLPKKGQSFEDYVVEESRKLDALYEKRKTSQGDEKIALKAAIDEQTRIVILRQFIYLRSDSGSVEKKT